MYKKKCFAFLPTEWLKKKKKKMPDVDCTVGSRRNDRDQQQTEFNRFGNRLLRIYAAIAFRNRKNRPRSYRTCVLSVLKHRRYARYVVEIVLPFGGTPVTRNDPFVLSPLSIFFLYATRALGARQVDSAVPERKARYSTMLHGTYECVD